MAKLTSVARNKLPKSKFGLPGRRAYPMPGASHAVNAKARASEEYRKGNLTKGEKAHIDRMADEVLKG